MAVSLNRVTLIGNVGRDPEVKSTQSGMKIANLAVATSESWMDRESNERKERTEWHKVVVFNEALIGIVERHIKKGSKVYVEGQLATRKWQDQSGQDRYSTEITLGKFGATLINLSPAPASSDARAEPARQTAPSQSRATSPGDNWGEDLSSF